MKNEGEKKRNIKTLQSRLVLINWVWMPYMFLLHIGKTDNLSKLQRVQHKHIHCVYTPLNINNVHLKFLLLQPSVGGKLQAQDIMHYTFVFSLHVLLFFLSWRLW